MSLLQELIASLNQKENYGLVQQIHGHFYYANRLLPSGASSALVENSDKSNLIALTLPTRLQKEKIETFVGDIVEIDFQNKVIKSVVPRLSMLTRPKVANIDQALVVVSVTQPEFEPEHLDRVLCHAGLTLPGKPIICVSKIDLKDVPAFFNLYGGLGYPIVPICNKTAQGIEELRPFLWKQASVLAGSSGVGKSSLLNVLLPNQNIKTGEVSHKSERGTHTTRHSQMFLIDDDEENSFYILDTPGFSRLDAHFGQEAIAQSKAFLEIGLKREPCYFEDCKHIDEKGCTVVFSESRRASYLKLMEEALRWERDQLESKKVKQESTGVKIDSDVNVPMLRSAQRATSRKKFKQSFNFEDELENKEGIDELFI
jgi:ribosome biogenesis GTPase / thiamine phosphate phosphatase